MTCSLVLSQFSWNRFSFDQSWTWLAASCILLCSPLEIVSDTVESSTYFHMLNGSEIERSFIRHDQKQPGPQLSSLGNTGGDHTPFRKTVLSQFDHLWSARKKTYNPVDDTEGMILRVKQKIFYLIFSLVTSTL